MPSPPPRLQHGQRTLGAAALWLYAAVLLLVAASAGLHGLETVLKPTPSNEGFSYGIGTFWMLAALATGALAYFVLRAGSGLRAGDVAARLPSWTLAGAMLLFVLGAMWIYTAVASSLTVLERLRTPGILLIVVAVLVGLAAYLWPMGHRVAAALFGTLAAALMLVVGQFKVVANILATVAVPLGFLATVGLVLVALAAVVVAARPGMRPVAVMILGAGGILLCIAALVAMSDLLAEDPFGAAFEATRPLVAVGSFLHGVGAVLLGVSGAAGLVATLLAMVAQGPAIQSVGFLGRRQACQKCASPLAGPARFCAACGHRAAT